MKNVMIYPSVLMTMECPYCNAKGKIKKNNPPEKDFKVNCAKCKKTFLVLLNKRDFYRKPVLITIYFSRVGFNDPFEDSVRQGKIRNISRTGLFFESNLTRQILKDFKKGDTLSLLFALSAEQNTIKVRGKITTITEDKGQTTKIGVEFLDLDEHQNKLIGFYLMK